MQKIVWTTESREPHVTVTVHLHIVPFATLQAQETHFLSPVPPSNDSLNTPFFDYAFPTETSVRH